MGRPLQQGEQLHCHQPLQADLFDPERKPSLSRLGVRTVAALNELLAGTSAADSLLVTSFVAIQEAPAPQHLDYRSRPWRCPPRCCSTPAHPSSTGRRSSAPARRRPRHRSQTTGQRWCPAGRHRGRCGNGSSLRSGSAGPVSQRLSRHPSASPHAAARVRPVGVSSLPSCRWIAQLLAVAVTP